MGLSFGGAGGGGVPGTPGLPGSHGTSGDGGTPGAPGGNSIRDIINNITNSTNTIPAPPLYAVQFNNPLETFDGDAGFTFNPTSLLATLTRAVDGDYEGLRIVNSTAADAGTNERALITFGFGSDTDVAQIAIGKVASYQTDSAKDSRMQFSVDKNGTLLEVLRIGEVGLSILSGADPNNGIDLETNMAIGSGYSGTSAAPSNGLIVQGQVGIGTSGTPGILGELTVGDGVGQAAIYIRGKNSHGAPAQLYFNDESDEDICSIAWISVANTGTIPFGVNMEFNFDTGINGFFLFRNEGNSSGTSMANEPHGIVISNYSVGGGLITTSWNITSGTAFSAIRYNAFYAPTFIGVAGGAAESATSAATLYIDNAPIAGADFTITNAYAFWVDAGLARFDGNGTYVFELPADATDPTGGGGAAAGRIPVTIGGATKYLAYY